MPALPSRATLEEMKRPDVFRTMASKQISRQMPSSSSCSTQSLSSVAKLPLFPTFISRKANPRTAAPPTRRSVSTRHTSRSAPRISSVIIHDTDDEEDDDNEPEIDEEETENKPQPVEPEPIPATTRTRKAKETQTRLGVGRPVAAGGNGPRAVTKSISVAKGKRGKNSKAIKPVEDTIPEEVEEEQPPQAGPSDLTIAGPFTALEAFDPAAQDLQVHEASASETSAVLSGAIVDAIRQQLQTLKSELDQIPILKAELAQLRKQVADMQHLEHKVITLTAQVDTLTAQSVTVTALDAELKQLKAAGMVATSSRIPPNPSTPRFQSPVPRPSSAYGNASSVNASSSDGKTVSPIKNHDLPDPGIAPSMLGKRHRESTSSNLTGVIEEGQEGDLSEDELAKRVIRPTKKRARLQEEDEHDFVVAEDPDLQSAPRVPSFTVFSGEEEEPFIDPPPPTESLPEFYVPSSPTGSGSRQGTTTSTQNASENQHPFTFAFLPISSTPVNSAFNLPSFPYPEAPTSPSPAGPAHNGPSRNHGERTDIFESFGLPPPGRPRSRVTSTSAGSAASRDHATGSMGVDPAALTQRPTDREREAAAAGFGFVRPLSASDDDGDAPGLKRAYGTMYGTELEGDTRFGDFGLEGVATGFWASGRF